MEHYLYSKAKYAFIPISMIKIFFLAGPIKRFPLLISLGLKKEATCCLTPRFALLLLINVR